MNNTNFIQDCIAGRATAADIEGYIDRWHQSPGNESIHSFLGMSADQYARYVDDEEYLLTVIAIHRQSTGL